MFPGTAIGKVLPSYIVFEVEHIWDSWCNGGPKDTQYDREKFGWFDGTIFSDWFNTFIVAHLIN